MVLAIEFDSRFSGWDGLPHDEHLDDTPGDDVVDKHREDGSPLKYAAFDFGDTEDGDKRRSEWCGHHVDEVREASTGVGSEELQDEAKGEEDFDETEEIPDDLGATVERLRTAWRLGVHRGNTNNYCGRPAWTALATWSVIIKVNYPSTSSILSLRENSELVSENDWNKKHLEGGIDTEIWVCVYTR